MLHPRAAKTKQKQKKRWRRVAHQPGQWNMYVPACDGVIIDKDKDWGQVGDFVPGLSWFVFLSVHLSLYDWLSTTIDWRSFPHPIIPIQRLDFVRRRTPTFFYRPQLWPQFVPLFLWLCMPPQQLYNLFLSYYPCFFFFNLSSFFWDSRWSYLAK